jgi:hypothetical protein
LYTADYRFAASPADPGKFRNTGLRLTPWRAVAVWPTEQACVDEIGRREAAERARIVAAAKAGQGLPTTISGWLCREGPDHAT